MLFKKQELIATFSAAYCCKNDLCLTYIEGENLLFDMTGYTAEEIKGTLGNGLIQLVVEDKREGIQKELQSQLETREEVELLLPILCKNGNVKWIVNRGRKTVLADGQECLIGILVDITVLKGKYDEEKLATSVLQNQAERDSLTQLYNANTTRKKTIEYLAEQSNRGECALLIIDMDNFKMVNDRKGHLVGDEVLVQAAQTIKKLFRVQDVVGRIGGDEFLVLMKDISDQEIVRKRCEQLNEEFHEIYKEHLGENRLSCSIGVAFSPSHGDSYVELFHCADKALYEAKALGRDQYVFYQVD